MKRYVWEYKPLGEPTLTGRTPPSTHCAIEYKEGDVLLRHGVVCVHDEYTAENGELIDLMKARMVEVLDKWLETKLKEQP